jgi:hypothetical protein
MILFAKADHYNLMHYLAQAGLLPPSRLTETAPGRARAKLFLVVPELASWNEMSELSGLPADELRKLPLVDRGGYYHIRATPEPVEIPFQHVEASK